MIYICIFFGILIKLLIIFPSSMPINLVIYFVEVYMEKASTFNKSIIVDTFILNLNKLLIYHSGMITSKKSMVIGLNSGI
jgi:hypothetical protein